MHPGSSQLLPPSPASSSAAQRRPHLKQIAFQVKLERLLSCHAQVGREAQGGGEGASCLAYMALLTSPLVELWCIAPGRSAVCHAERACDSPWGGGARATFPCGPLNLGAGLPVLLFHRLLLSRTKRILLDRGVQLGCSQALHALHGRLLL